MMKNLNIDKFAKDILKNSYLEVTDPDFTATTMKKIMRASRRQHVLENILLCSLIFIAIDTFIFLILWLTHLNIFDLATRLYNLTNVIPIHADKLMNLIIENAFMEYFLISFGGLMVVWMIVESISKLSETPKLRG
jgi:uncharacterized membrane protein